MKIVFSDTIMDAYFISHFCLNILFMIAFIGLLKSIFCEIQQKISNKAVKILQVNSSSYSDSVLVISLVQILMICILITVIKLEFLITPNFFLFPTGDFVIFFQIILLIKIGNFTRETIVKDLITFGCCLFLLLLLININKENHTCLLELLNMFIIKLLLLGPPTLCLMISTFIIATCQRLSDILPTILISFVLTLTFAPLLKNSKKVIFPTLLLQFIALFSIQHENNFILQQNDLLLTSSSPPLHCKYLKIENYSAFEDIVPKFCHELEKAVSSKAELNEEIFKSNYPENRNFVSVRRQFLVFFAKNNARDCLVEAVDVTDKNFIIKSFIQISSFINQFIGVRFKMFNLVSLQGYSSYSCKKLIGKEVVSTSIVFTNNQTHDDYFDWKLINISHSTNNYINSIFSMFTQARSALVDLIF